MVPELARQAVIIKSKNNTSVILGNYECAYALGIMSQAAGLPEDATYIDMTLWHKDVMEELAGFAPQNENQAQVLRMLELLEPDGEMDDQVKELYKMGYHEQRPWEI